MESYYPFVKPNYITKNGDTPIYIKYNYNRVKRTLIPVKININPSHWDFKKKKLKKACPYYEKYEKEIRKLYNKISKIIEYANDYGIDPSIDFVISQLNKKFDLKGKNGDDFFSVLDKFIEEAQTRVVKDVIKDYKALRKHLIGFSKYAKQDISFNTINYSFYQHFVSYLTFNAVKPDKTKGLATNTVGKQIKNLKVFLKDCIRKNICKPIDLTDFKTLTEEVDKIYLTTDEIKRIADLDLSNNKELDIIRDYLLIGCLTGLRFSDFSTIEKYHIKGDFIEKKISKTHRMQKIPLKRKIREILNKYENNLPKINGLKFNKLAKKIGQLALINEEIEQVYKKGGEKIKTINKKYELISSHTCRRSFCTNEFLAGTPLIYIMKMSGHKTQKSFMRYLKIDEDAAAEKMLEIWNKEL